MYKITYDNSRVTIETKPTTKAKDRLIRYNGLLMKLIGNGSAGAISLVTIANAFKNPSAENLSLAAAFTAGAGYIFNLGEKSRFGKTPISQEITLDGNQITIETDFLGHLSSENFNAQFVDINIHEDPNIKLASVLLIYGDRCIPIMCSVETNEVNEIFNIISSHIRNQRVHDSNKPPLPSQKYQ